MKLYRYSPIETEATFKEAVEYIAKTTTRMLFKLQGYTLQIESLTIFAHYEDEYDKLVKIGEGLGVKEEANNGVRFRLKESMKISAMNLEVNGKDEEVVDNIKYVRIRKPDPYRMQVGCCDFEYTDEDLNYEFLARTDIHTSKNARQIERPDLDMVEFFHPDYDVLAYILKK